MAPGPIQRKERGAAVLLVEDDDDARDLLQTALGDAGYEVLPAANGAEALSILQDRKTQGGGGPACNLILLDLMMPVLNGWDFRRRQKADPALAGIPVVLMSAGAHIAAAAGDLDAADSVTKPVDLPDLLAKVSRYSR